MRCIYCNNVINKINISSILFEQDKLCVNCCDKLKINKKKINLGSIKVETFYNYDDGIFRDLLIQYKECFDEALSDVFLYSIKDYIRLKYHSYNLLFVPSSSTKKQERGFDHLPLMFKEFKLKQVKGLAMKEDLIQEGKNFNERRQMTNNYVYIGDRLKKVLIIDDVITTGSSLLGVYRAIKPHCDCIRAIALSRKENAFIKGNVC